MGTGDWEVEHNWGMTTTFGTMIRIFSEGSYLSSTKRMRAIENYSGGWRLWFVTRRRTRWTSRCELDAPELFRWNGDHDLERNSTMIPPLYHDDDDNDSVVFELQT